MMLREVIDNLPKMAGDEEQNRIQQSSWEEPQYGGLIDAHFLWMILKYIIAAYIVFQITIFIWYL